MFDSRRAALAAVALGLMWAASPAAAASPTKPAAAPAKAAKGAKAAKPARPALPAPPPEDVARMTDWVLATGDNGDKPFVIIDKVAAKVFVFRPDGTLRGAGPALVGAARGDNSTPGVGDREMSAIRPSERTTPAGRFVANFGTAAGKRKVLWVDYPTAISLHPVVTAHPQERRPQRLASATPKDNRITYGCINVAPAFYEKVVRKAFTGTYGIVYILPEKAPLEAAFPTYRVLASTAPVGDLPGP
jgi:hypothetical protein